VPSGIWHPDEYGKLPGFDGTSSQTSVFLCHQQDGRLCAGWVGCHDMGSALGIRIAAAFGHLTEADVDEVLDYTTDVPLFALGADAAAHGLRDVKRPGRRAITKIEGLKRKERTT